MTPPIHRSSTRPDARGVLSPPGGLTRAVVWGISCVLVLAAAGMFFLVRDALVVDARSWLPNGKEDSSPERSVAENGAGEASSTESPSSPPEVAIPKAPTWSLVQVGDAVQEAVPKLQALIREGRDEAGEFVAMTSKDATKSERAKRQWGAWGQIWKNRVALVTRSLPPAEACAVHASMEPACETFGSILRTLRSVPDDQKVETALGRLDQAEAILEEFLNPPEPEVLLPSEEDGEDVEPEAP